MITPCAIPVNSSKEDVSDDASREALFKDFHPQDVSAVQIHLENEHLQKDSAQVFHETDDDHVIASVITAIVPLTVPTLY